MIAATAAVLVVASPAAAAHVGAPARLHPGSVVYVHSNCCVSLTYPSVHAAGAPVNQNGSATIRWRVPTQYAQCVSSICSSPEYKRFRRGESVLVDVSTTDDTAFADSTAPHHLNQPGSKRGQHQDCN